MAIKDGIKPLYEKVDESLADVAATVEKAIDRVPMASRLYPDVYAGEVAKALREAGLIKENIDG